MLISIMALRSFQTKLTNMPEITRARSKGFIYPSSSPADLYCTPACTQLSGISSSAACKSCCPAICIFWQMKKIQQTGEAVYSKKNVPNIAELLITHTKY
jgi:hypothetical protein